MNSKDLAKQARTQFSAGDKQGARQSVQQMNAATTKKREMQRTGRLGFSR